MFSVYTYILKLVDKMVSYPSNLLLWFLYSSNSLKYVCSSASDVLYLKKICLSMNFVLNKKHLIAFMYADGSELNFL